MWVAAAGLECFRFQNKIDSKFKRALSDLFSDPGPGYNKYAWNRKESRDADDDAISPLLPVFSALELKRIALGIETKDDIPHPPP